MNPLISSLTPAFWLETLLAPTCAVGLLFALAGALASRLGSGRAQRAAWLTAFLAAALFFGGWLLGVENWTRSDIRVPERSGPVFRVRTNLPVGDAPAADGILPAVAPASFVEPGRMAVAAPVNGLWPGLIWAGGTFLLLARTVAQRWGLTVALRRSAGDAGPELSQRVLRIAASMGLRRNIRVGEVCDLVGPAAYGWWRPTVLVPRGFLAAHSDRRLDAMLSHELAHLAARDPLWQGMARVFAALLWWHPVVWWGLGRLRAASETAADEASVLVENGPEELAACLVALGGRLQGQRAGWLGMAGSGFRSHLGRRVERLLQLPSEGATWRPRRRIAVGIVIGGLIGAAGSLGVSAWAKASDAPGRSPLSMLAEQVLAGQFAQSRSPASPSESVDPIQPTEGAPEAGASTVAVSSPAVAGVGEAAPGAGAGSGTVEVRLDPAGRFFLDGQEIGLEALRARVAERHQAQPELAVRLVADRESRAEYVASVMTLLSAEGVTRVSLETAGSAGEVESAKIGGADPAADVVPVPETSDAAPGLVTRLYKLNPGMVLESLPKPPSLPESLAPAGARLENPASGGRAPLEPGQTAGEPGSASEDSSLNTRLLWQLFAAAGVDWGGENVFTAVASGAGLQSGNGKGLFYNPQNGVMLVRATAADQEVIASTLQVLNSAPPQVTIEAKFVETTDADAQALGFDWFLGTAVAGGGTNQPGVQGGTASVDLAGPGATQASKNVGGGAGLFPGAPTPLGATNGPGPVADERLQLFQGNQFEWPGKQLPGAENMRVLAAARGGVTGILTDPQYRVVLRALEQRDNVDIMAAPRVTTVSGRQAQIQIVDLRTVVNGLNPEVLAPLPADAEAATNAVPFRTVQVPVGPVLDVIPFVEADGLTLNLTLIATVTEFLGYDEPPEASRVRVEIGGRSTLLEPPLPRFRVRQATTNVRLRDGQTVVLGGMAVRDVQHTVDKVPTLGDLPMVGRLFRSEGQQEVRKNLVVFVTATLIDPAGNRIHEGP
ncbi:MAG: M48 family metalloprotease [Verrucomicrobiales bacterium]|nr:M48 family metalloprotease [Verrucomicrobiales bacterium]